jgi:hypothetical protein
MPREAFEEVHLPCLAGARRRQGLGLLTEHNEDINTHVLPSNATDSADHDSRAAHHVPEIWQEAGKCEYYRQRK